MSEKVSGQGGSGRREKRVLSPSEKYEIWLQLMRQEVTVAQAASAQRVDRSTIMRIKQVAKDGALAQLGTTGWIEAGHPVVLLGDSGTGKSHLLIGLGIAAAENDKRVRYTTAAALVNELVEAADHKALARTINRYARLDLLCLDELNYVSLDPRGAELLFQIITAREERASIAVASNSPFSEWGNTFTDARLAAAVVDRLTFHATIITTGSQSYRLRTSQHKTSTPTTSAVSAT